MQAARIQVVVITGQREVKLIISTGHAAYRSQIIEHEI